MSGLSIRAIILIGLHNDDLQRVCGVKGVTVSALTLTNDSPTEVSCLSESKYVLYLQNDQNENETSHVSIPQQM